MNKHQIKRLVGYVLWIIGLTVFLPPTFLEENGPVRLYQFLLFNGMLVCLLGGFLLVDSANAVLKHRAHGSLAAAPSINEHVKVGDKHYHPPAPVPEALEDHEPDDMPAARSLFVVVALLLMAFVVIAVVIYGRSHREPLIQKGQEQGTVQVR